MVITRHLWALSLYSSRCLSDNGLVSPTEPGGIEFAKAVLVILDVVNYRPIGISEEMPLTSCSSNHVPLIMTQSGVSVYLTGTEGNS